MEKDMYMNSLIIVTLELCLGYVNSVKKERLQVKRNTLNLLGML